jgi:hypothetical protein
MFVHGVRLRRARATRSGSADLDFVVEDREAILALDHG